MLRYLGGKQKAKLRMDSIADFIIHNIAENSNETHRYSHIQNGGYINIEDMCVELFETMDMNMVSELVLYLDNLGCQRATLISFKYDGRKCEIGEHFDTQRDYFWVRMLPVDN